MHSNRVSFIVVLIMMTAVAAPLYWFFVPARSQVPDSQLQEITYIDMKSGELFSLRARKSPETNPETGEQTLVPAMYCKECIAWKPVGSLELLQSRGAARNCPIHKTPLLVDAK